MSEACISNMPDLLASLKVDLGITTTRYDERLRQYLLSAISFIEEEGAQLDSASIKDQQLIVMYAEWMWRRRDSGEGMPRMLRYALNNKIFAGKMGESNG